MQVLIFLFMSLPLQAQDAKQKAAMCAACHGDNGISANTLWPNLAAQKADYLQKQLKAFRDGVRVDPLMSPVSKTLSDEDIQLLAKYYSDLKGGP